MRFNDRVQCLAVCDYNAGGIIIAARCQKDCRHGHGTKRQGFLFHRVDVTLPDGAKVKLTWDGIGIMTPEFAAERAEREASRRNRKHIPGDLTWKGDE